MTRLVSGKAVKVPSANVSADRYQFIELGETEPDLGLPPANNYALSSDPQGNREWIDLTTTLGNSDVAIGNVYAAGTLYGNNLIVRNIDILDALIGETTLANVVLAREVYAANVTTDRITSNIWEGIYTANVIESPENLYYSNDRVHANLNVSSIDIFRDVADLSNIDFGQGLIWDGNAFAPVYISSDLANIADLAIRVTSLENFTTANVAEASSNLYFTNARAVAALAGANVLLNDLFVAGDLVVQGNSAILNVATLVVEDKNIILANGATSAAIADGAGISIQGADANITYRESGDKIEINKNLDVQGNIIAGSGTGGSITGANVITTEALAADLLVTDTIVSNTILNTAGITAETVFGNVVANIISTDSFGARSIDANAITSNLLSISGVARVNGYDVLTKELTDATFEPMGHEDRANSVISFEANTRTFTIQPTDSSYTVWVKGQKFVKTSAESVTIPTDTTDLYYVYFNTDGNIALRSSYFDWENDAPTAYIYYNANTGSAPFFADERHGITLDWATHEYLHRTRGAVIAEGFSIGSYTLNNDGSSDANAQISIGNGTFFDEDLQVDVVHSNSPTPNTWEQDLQGPARIPVFYLVGTEWVRDEPTDFALKQGTARIKYNLLSGGQWATPDVPTNGYFTTSWIIATNNLNYPILAIMGQTASETIGQEEEINFQDLTLTDFPVIEFRPLYKIIWSTNTGYANTPKAIISRIYDLRNIISASPTAAIASDHGLLSGLGDDDHAQYLHIENARTVTASHTFSGIQAFANITVSGSMIGNLTGQVSDISNHSINALYDVDTTNATVNSTLIWDGTKFITGAADTALFSERANLASEANLVLTLSNFTTDDLNEGANLYFTNARARAAFSAGRGIIIQENGVIKSVDDSDLYNLDLNGSVIQDITLDMAPILSLPTTPSSVSYVVQSLHVTNISEETALLSANVVFASNSTVTLFDKLALPVGASMELFDKSLALRPGDKLNVQSFNQSEVATSNVISAFLVYESVLEDESFVNAGTDVGNPDSNVLLYNSNLSYTILESIKISNLEDIDIPVRVYVTDANTNIKGYLTHKMPIPSNSVVDILKKPKRLERNDRIYINYTDAANTDAISAFLSGRIGAYYVLDIVPSEVTPGTQTVIGFETTSTEGTQLYYTIRPA